MEPYIDEITTNGYKKISIPKKTIYYDEEHLLHEITEQDIDMIETIDENSNIKKNINTHNETKKNDKKDELYFVANKTITTITETTNEYISHMKEYKINHFNNVNKMTNDLIFSKEVRKLYNGEIITKIYDIKKKYINNNITEDIWNYKLEHLKTKNNIPYVFTETKTCSNGVTTKGYSLTTKDDNIDDNLFYEYFIL